MSREAGRAVASWCGLTDRVDGLDGRHEHDVRGQSCAGGSIVGPTHPERRDEPWCRSPCADRSRSWEIVGVAPASNGHGQSWHRWTRLLQPGMRCQHEPTRSGGRQNGYLLPVEMRRPTHDLGRDACAQALGSWPGGRRQPFHGGQSLVGLRGRSRRPSLSCEYDKPSGIAGVA